MACLTTVSVRAVSAVADCCANAGVLSKKAIAVANEVKRFMFLKFLTVNR